LHCLKSSGELGMGNWEWGIGNGELGIGERVGRKFLMREVLCLLVRKKN
jgi:hypothetical protein